VSIKHVILGFLSETPMTGYDLKKKFSSSEIFHWSGNNNQIYKALVELHNEQLVTVEVQYQASKPPRKIYTINPAGQDALREWMQSTPELPQFHNALSMRLTWAEQLESDALGAMLAVYEEEIQVHLAMLREQAQRNAKNTKALASRAAAHLISFYELELDWVRELRQAIEDE